MNPCEYSLSLKESLINLKCVNKVGRCGYHVENQRYGLSALLPEGLCPEAYHNLYFISLGLLFNARFNKERFMVKCPGEKNFVVFKAGFEKLNLRFRLFNLIKRLFQWAYPGQVYRYGRLVWTVIEIKGSCPLGITVGSKYYINMGNIQLTKKLLFPMGQPNELCPAAFDSLFPTLPPLLLEEGFPYSNDSPDRFQCPDHLVNITFEISKENK